MNYLTFEEVFSKSRVDKYLKACNDNKHSAISLYRQNNKLSQRTYGALSIFEVILRNAINKHYIEFFNDENWIRHQFEPGKMLWNHPQRASIERIIRDLKSSNKYSNDRAVSSFSFGFWTHLFSRRPFALGGQSLLQIFPYRTKGLGQRVIYNELQSIKAFRNRIAHQESICFNAYGQIDTTPCRELFSRINKYLCFLGHEGYNPYYGFNVNPEKILSKIDSI